MKGWIRYGYYCYFVGTETKTFEEAKQTCVKSDSNLVDITSRSEIFVMENAIKIN